MNRYTYALLAVIVVVMVIVFLQLGNAYTPNVFSNAP